MPRVSFTTALRREYDQLFITCDITGNRLPAVDAIVEKLQANKSRYLTISGTTGIPWEFVAVIHNMESGLSFTKHLHNGDPLTQRTVHVPAGRPRKGSPPFTWEESAIDALTLKKLDAQTDWSLAGTLYQLERYNGWGYRLYHQHVLSPYLWSFSGHYKSGKYVADGRWSDTAVSKQCGSAVLLRRMAERDIIVFHDQPAPAPDDQPLVVHFSMNKSPDASVVRQTENLQRWLNTHPGIYVVVDGIPGTRTSNAYRKITGLYLPGDDRG